MKLKPEGVLKSWMGFLADSTSGIASVLVDETLIWDTGTRASSSLLFPTGNRRPGFSWNGSTARKVQFCLLQQAGETGLSSSQKRLLSTEGCIFFCPCYYLLIQNRTITTGGARKEQLWLSLQLSLDYLGLKPLLPWLCVRVLVLAFYMSETFSAQYLGRSYSIALWLLLNEKKSLKNFAFLRQTIF